MGVKFVYFPRSVHETSSIPFLVLLDDPARSCWRHPTIFWGVENWRDYLGSTSSLLDTEYIGRLVNVIFTLFKPVTGLASLWILLIRIFATLYWRLSKVRLKFNCLSCFIQSGRCRILGYWIDKIFLVCYLHSVHHGRAYHTLSIFGNNLLSWVLKLSRRSEAGHLATLLGPLRAAPLLDTIRATSWDATTIAIISAASWLRDDFYAVAPRAYTLELCLVELSQSVLIEFSCWVNIPSGTLLHLLARRRQDRDLMEFIAELVLLKIRRYGQVYFDLDVEGSSDGAIHDPIGTNLWVMCYRHSLLLLSLVCIFVIRSLRHYTLILMVTHHANWREDRVAVLIRFKLYLVMIWCQCLLLDSALIADAWNIFCHPVALFSSSCTNLALKLLLQSRGLRPAIRAAIWAIASKSTALGRHFLWAKFLHDILCQNLWRVASLAKTWFLA